MASNNWNAFLVMIMVISPALAAGMSAIIAIRKIVATKLLKPGPGPSHFTAAFSFISLTVSIYLINNYRQGPALTSPFYLDELSLLFILVVNIVAFFASIYTIQGGKTVPLRENYEINFFHPFFNLFHLTMLLVPLMDDMVLLWMMVELTTVFSTILVMHRGDRRANEAAWKFLIITTTGIIFGLLGTILLSYAIPKSLVIEELHWSTLSDPGIAAQLNKQVVVISFMLILLGYGTKAGLAPMHTWLPDGHGEAPAPVSAMLSGVMLKIAFYAILRFFSIARLALGCDNVFIFNLLLMTGLVSLLVATPLILKQNNRFKRILAYHSLEHMGIISFGIGIGTPLAVFGALLHTMNHAITKALMFLIYGNIQDRYWQPKQVKSDDSKDWGDNIGEIWTKLPFHGTLLAGGGLALVGSPPFSIFLSEFIILLAALQKATTGGGQYMWLVIAAIPLYLLTLALIFGGLVRHISRLLFDPIPDEAPRPIINNPGWVDFIRNTIFLLMLALLLGSGVLLPNLSGFPDLLEKAANIVLGDNLKCGN